MQRWVISFLVFVLACGGAPPSVTNVQLQPDQAPVDDGRFAAVVASPPPPRPQRQIDRGTAGPAELRKAPLDKTLTTTTPTETEPPHDAALLIYTAHVVMAVYQVGPALDAIEGVARAMGGYLSSRNDTQIEIRVPRAKFDEALRTIEASGDVVHRDVTAQDVTDAFVDTEARLKNARAVRDRLQALLEKAAVKEAIEIQRELERVTTEIEVLEGKLKLLHDRVAYSTIGVAFEARGSAALHDAPVRLPFPWLSQLGLPHLLNMAR